MISLPSNKYPNYQDGIGTSSFKLFAIIGGAFGWGLKRNVIDAYIYLCRTYAPEDKIYLFGFSRGGFTARILLGLIRDQGLLTCRRRDELDRYAVDAYRAYRRCFKQTGRHIRVLRSLRDASIKLFRFLSGHPSYEQIKSANESAEVHFIGVWDTVSAYGLPIAELTRGIDRWIWPLSLPDQRLPEGVKIARHALSLDDERAAFHPLLWDEINSQEPDRILQVWFAGMHADVGGGYPNDRLASIPLTWMMAAAREAGLRFKKDVLEEAERWLDPCAPMHDSRQFFGAYYRYQPRRLSALIEPPEPDTLAMRSTALGNRGLLWDVKIHISVIERIISGHEGYAPLVLPESFTIVGRGRAQLWSAFGDPREKEEEEEFRHVIRGIPSKDLDDLFLWERVWLKRVIHVLMVIATFTLLVYPFFVETDRGCEGPACLFGPILSGLGTLLPYGLRGWAHGIGNSPTQFVYLLVLLGFLLALSRHHQLQIRDAMRDLWDYALSSTSSGGAREVKNYVYVSA